MENLTKREPSLAWRAVVAGGVGAAFLVADQLTKLAVRDALVPVGSWGVHVIPSILDFALVENRGASFGMGQGMGFLFVLLALAVAVVIPTYLARSPQVSRVEVVGLGMVMGGAIGNAIDRVLLGYVTDFIAVSFIDFPVFNVADIGITCGVAVAFIGFMFLSPASRVDATAGLNRRDAERRARRGAGKGSR